MARESLCLAFSGFILIIFMLLWCATLCALAEFSTDPLFNRSPLNAVEILGTPQPAAEPLSSLRTGAIINYFRNQLGTPLSRDSVRKHCVPGPRRHGMPTCWIKNCMESPT
ncbi:hypothetical protein C8J57DRAFT_1465090 [Mycena rebaudengoi]|nr:hypothetical protein C8J57DRAFT_1465090 [Mycena rebaudengoi]